MRAWLNRAKKMVILSVIGAKRIVEFGTSRIFARHIVMGDE